MNPFFLTAFMYFGLAMLVALAAALNHFGLMPWLSGLQWFRIHFITLGIFTEFTFGLLPAVVANRTGQAAPKPQLLTWLALTAGITTLLVGIPLVNPVAITTGGGLVFLAVVLLIQQLLSLGGRVSVEPSASSKFYLTGLGFLLLGITVGTGLWQPWLGYLGIAVPLEVHIHANGWGFMSLVFAGFLFDLLPEITGKSLGSSRTQTIIFWLMSVGAAGLVLGPWLGSKLVTAPTMLMHAAATILLLWQVWLAFGTSLSRWSAGNWHILSAYAWQFAPLLFAPFVLFELAGIPGARIEQTAPEALIYGWVLQFSFALIPYGIHRLLTLDSKAKLGGSWFSLLAVHLGGLTLWSSVFLVSQVAILQGLAYGLWALASVPIFWQVWQLIRDFERTQENSNAKLSQV